MLGIRHYKNFAIDLWQGNITHFMSDVTCCFWLETGKPLNEESTKVVMSMPSELKTQACDSLKDQDIFIQTADLNYVKHLLHVKSSFQTNELLKFVLNQSNDLSARHVCIPNMGEKVSSELIMNELKINLDAMKAKSLSRITFILENSDQYQEMQDALFKVFN